MLAAFTSPDHANTRSLIAAISCAAVCGIVFGLSMPLISLRLEHMTGSGLMVGLNGTVAALSTLIMAPLVPRLMTLAPPRLIIMGCLIAASAQFVLLPIFPNVPAWFLLRFTTGCAITVIFVISETWINQIVSSEKRALMLGVYGTALSGGFGIGGLLFASFGSSGDIAFFLGSAIFLLGLGPVLLLRGPDATAPDAESASTKAMLRACLVAPAAIFAGLAFGAIETLIFSMLPVYGERIALDVGAIGAMVFAVAMGALAFQIPLGWIADRTDRRTTLLVIAALATLTPLLVGWAGNDLRLLLPLLFVQSGVTSGLYTIGLSLLGERFTGGAIASANAAFIFVYGIGSLAAPPAAGAAMDTVGPGGLLITLSVIAGGYVLIVLSRTLTTARRG